MTLLVCRNSRAAAWSPTKVRFFDNQRQKKFIPGPGTYNPSDVDSTNGSYITSNFRNLGNTKFIKPRVKEQFRSKTPANRVGKLPHPPQSYPHIQSLSTLSTFPFSS